MACILSQPQCVKWTNPKLPTSGHGDLFQVIEVFLAPTQSWRAFRLFWLARFLTREAFGRQFADNTFKCIFLNENVTISIKISLKFVAKGPINNIPALVQIMAWRRPGDKPLSEPMMVSLPTHICVTRPQWVNTWSQWPSVCRQHFQMHFLEWKC